MGGFKHRSPVFVDEQNFRYFRSQWAEIDRLWPACSDLEHSAVYEGLRENARDALRAEMRSVTVLGIPAYMIPL